VRIKAGILNAVEERGLPSEKMDMGKDLNGVPVNWTLGQHRELEIKNRDFWDRRHKRSDAAKRGWQNRRAMVTP